MPTKIVLFSTLASAQGTSSYGGRAWVYLGGDIAELRHCTEVLGPVLRVSTGHSLERVAHQIRQPFIDWMGKLASMQRDLDSFWGITFTARSPETSDLFELTCQATLLDELAQEKPELVAVIEDPWLFTLLAERYECEGSFHASLDLKRQAVRGLCRTLPARLAFFARGAVRIFRSRVLGLGQKKAKRRTRLVGYAFDQALSKSPYVDPFFGDLPKLLSERETGVSFLFPLHTPSKLFGRIAKVQKAEALAAWATLPDLLVSGFGWAKLEPSVPNFMGNSIEWLLRRELLSENSSNRYVLNLWQAKTWRRFAKRAQGAVVHIFENHPWEKSLNAALHKTSVKRIGYQHTTIPELLLNYYPALGEERFHPQWIVANSPMNQEILKAHGWKSASVSMGGALRYSGTQGMFEAPARLMNAIPTLYVVLPGAPGLARSFIAALIEAGQDLDEGRSRVRLLLKFHPSSSLSECDFSGIKGAEQTSESLDKIASSIDAVLFASSTLGLEAVLLGLPVYRYVPEGRLSLDPIPSFYSDRVKPCDQAGLKTLLRTLAPRSTALKSDPEAERVLFAPVESQVWLRVLEGKV